MAASWRLAVIKGPTFGYAYQELGRRRTEMPWPAPFLPALSACLKEQT